MDGQMVQEMINILKYSVSSGLDVKDCIEILERTFSSDILTFHEDEVEEAFDVIGWGREYTAWRDHGDKGVIRSSLDKQMENTTGKSTKYLHEMSLSDIFGKKVKSLNDVQTVGDLKKLIKYAQSAKRAKAGKEAAEEWAKSSLWDETFGKIPGLSTAKNATDMLKAMYDTPDDARTGTALDHMDVDDDIAKIVDDPIENAFLKQYTKDLENEDDDRPLSDVNVTKELSNFIKSKFNDRTVIGFNEGKKRKMRITESKLRRIIRRSLLTEHLHGWEGKTKAKYMQREYPPEALQLEHWGEWEEEFRSTKEAIEDNYRKMTALSIDFPKMNTNNVDEDAMDYKHYGQMTATEKYVYCKNDLMYLWEDLIRLWKELDDELGITDGFAGY